MTNDFNINTVRKQLNALRSKHGAQSEVGFRCSTLIEQLKHYATYSGEARVKMEKEDRADGCGAGEPDGSALMKNVGEVFEFIDS